MERQKLPGRRIERQAEHESVRIARAVLVAPVPVTEFLGRRRSGGSLLDLPFVEVALIQKSGTSVPSAGLIMPVGGKVLEGESLTNGALREVSEEVTMTTFSDDQVVNETDEDIKGFTYLAPGYEEARATKLFVIPVQSRSFSMHKPREKAEGPVDKIARVVRLTPDELSSLVRNGSIERGEEVLKAAGNFTTADEDSITISDEEKAKREIALDDVLSDVEKFEKTLRQATLAAVNRVRTKKKIPLAYNLSECDESEIATGYVGAQLFMALSDEAKKEEEEGPHKKKSLLTALPYFASALPASELSNLIYSVPSKEGVQAAIQFEKAFCKGAEVVISGLSERDGERVLFQDTSFGEIIDVWPQVLRLPLTERVDLIRNAEDAVMNEIREVTGAKQEDVSEALRVVANFHESITDEIKNVVPNVFQEYRPMNELANARVFTLMIYALGLHPNIPVEDKSEIVLRTLRLEALRGLAVFNVALEVAKQIREADNSIFQGALDKFFKFPPNIELSDLGEGRLHPVYHRPTKVQVGDKNIHVLADERPKKTTISATRKRFLSPFLNDIFSVNFALADDNYTNSDNPIGQRLELAQQFKEVLLEHIRQEAGPSWTVSIMDGTHKRDIVDKISKLDAGAEEAPREPVDTAKGGKRAGSSGDAIVREKFILHLESDKGKVQKVEINIYPFESTRSEGVSHLKQEGYWGFAEKILDDYTGKYKGMRILSRDPKTPTKPSLYELLYPPRFYKPQAASMKDRQIIARKSETGVDSTK